MVHCWWLVYIPSKSVMTYGGCQRVFTLGPPGVTQSAQGLTLLGASLSQCQMGVSCNYSIFPCLGRIIIHTLAQRSLTGLSPDSPP